MIFFRKRNKIKVTETLERVKNEDRLELEKGDLKAIMIAALIVFGPVVLIFCGGMFLLYWAFVARFL